MFEEIDRNAVAAAKDFLRQEAILLECVQQVDRGRVFEKFGYPSLFVYCTERLRLSEATAYAFISVARKSVQVPQLSRAVSDGVLSVSQAKRIVSVVEPANVVQWIEKAATTKQRELERAVAAVLPAPALSERVKPVGGGMSEMKLVIPEALFREIERLQEIRGCSVLDAIAYAVHETVERKDPIRQAQRKMPAPRPSSRIVRRAPVVWVKRAVVVRDQGQCTFRMGNGERCGNRRWLQLHHEKPFSLGGPSSVENLALVCASHHRIHHAETRAV